MALVRNLKYNLSKTIFNGLYRSQVSSYATKNVNPDVDEGPVKYSTHEASRMRFSFTQHPTVQSRLWYEPEENDVDASIGKSLYLTVPGLEEQDLLNLLSHYEKHGVDPAPIKKRLQELHEKKG